jgi:hypothetical protein
VSTVARKVVVAAVLLLTAACLSRRATSTAPVPTAWRDWSVAEAAAQRLLADGKGAAADSTLADFERRWPGTPQSEQGAWWRLVFQAERADDSASTAALVTRIDSILSTAPAAQRRAELLMLRRSAVVTQQLRTERNQARAERDAATRQRNEELEKLRAELAEVKAELDRVRNRVTRPRPPRP